MESQIHHDQTPQSAASMSRSVSGIPYANPAIERHKHDIFKPGITHIQEVPDGLNALALADLIRAYTENADTTRAWLHVTRNEKTMRRIAQIIRLYNPDIRIMAFPSWECLPYDRVGPASRFLARRIHTLVALHHHQHRPPKPTLILSTVNAMIQKHADPNVLAEHTFRAEIGQQVDIDALIAACVKNGFRKTDIVIEQGDYAVRGGIIDIYQPGGVPLRMDFFGDTLESVRQFDPDSQRSTKNRRTIVIIPANEVILSENAIALFRRQYRRQFDMSPTSENPLYESVSAGRPYQGMEHWLPLFYENLTSLDQAHDWAAISFDSLTEEAGIERLKLIEDHYTARLEQQNMESAFRNLPYNPLPPDSLYLNAQQWQCLNTHHAPNRPVIKFSPFRQDIGSDAHIIRLHGKQGRQFIAERKSMHGIFDGLKAHITAGANKHVAIACHSEGSVGRLKTLLEEQDIRAQEAHQWPPHGPGRHALSLVTLPIENGFETPNLMLIGEQDIFGERLIRPIRKKRTDIAFIKEAINLASGDLVVHVEHGIGRFEGLRTITIHDAPHECLMLIYAGADRLFLPVENLDLISRYGAKDAPLDKLGGAAWQEKKAKLKERITALAEKLMKTAALRALKTAHKMQVDNDIYRQFAAAFPFEETEDQQKAIEDVITDLQEGKPMDRLICGDVGFGKTEVAMRAAFIAAMNGMQTAVITPTTLLAKQHYNTFSTRFKHYPIRIDHYSRLVARKDKITVQKAIRQGDIDILIGTHALLSRDINFSKLGLLIIDEEQHFGVKHKEQLKQIRDNVHVLTLSATPIPRTLQLALSGARALSIIASPPIDRLNIRTFIAPFDSVSIRETLMREYYRGGQSFFVAPRIADIEKLNRFLHNSVPETKIAIAHGKMPPTQLDDVMSAFYERHYDILLSTSIIESGLDVPTANTLVVHRAHMFGLSQLYQLRGRIGRSKQRAYALFTTPPGQNLTETAEKRLQILQTLDKIGAGFMLANYDMDIRGAGNLLGEEQSGHIKEIGYELYQQMLNETMESLKGGGEQDEKEHWSPKIDIGLSVLIPEKYVPDLRLRLGLYRKIADLSSRRDVHDFTAEMHDRFGTLPPETSHLMQVVEIKILCKRAHIDYLNAGPRGLTVAFHDNRFPNPQKLIDFIDRQGSTAKLSTDHKLSIKRQWQNDADKMRDITETLSQIATLAQ